MSYVRYKTIKGKQYAYLQTSYREGKRVRTKSKYLGAVSGMFSGGEESIEERDRRKKKELARELALAMADSDREQVKWEAKCEAHNLEGAKKKAAPIPKSQPTAKDQVDLANRIEKWDAWHARQSEEYKENAPTDEGEKS